MAKLQLVIVTPERTTFDEEVDSVVLPLIDGESGILPGHSPMIGRLGPGELRVIDGGTTTRFYLDGGFAQIEGYSVTVLPGQSIPAGEIDVNAAKTELDQAQTLPSGNADLAAIKTKAVSQARAKIRVAGNA
ncbi:MAG: ATP synthase F1 subunit epsilon [Planctomycetota bacterium]